MFSKPSSVGDFPHTKDPPSSQKPSDKLPDTSPVENCDNKW